MQDTVYYIHSLLAHTKQGVEPMYSTLAMSLTFHIFSAILICSSLFVSYLHLLSKGHLPLSLGHDPASNTRTQTLEESNR